MFCSWVSFCCSIERFSLLWMVMGMLLWLCRVLGNYCLIWFCWFGVSECYYCLIFLGLLFGGGICGIVGGVWLSWVLICLCDKFLVVYWIVVVRFLLVVLVLVSRCLMFFGLWCWGWFVDWLGNMMISWVVVMLYWLCKWLLGDVYVWYCGLFVVVFWLWWFFWLFFLWFVWLFYMCWYGDWVVLLCDGLLFVLFWWLYC